MQVVEHLAGRASPPSDSTEEHREACHDLSVGIAQDRVDTHTLKALEQLLGAKGLQFLATFLRLAEAKQHAFAEMDTADCAVITAKTIRDMAKRIGWGYDTTEKYLVVLCALHFLYKEKSTAGSAYFFPLHRYTPHRATLDALEEVIGHYRPKVQSFARKAKRRFLVYVDQQKSPFLPLPTPVSRPFDLSGVEGDIERIMQEELGSGVIPQRLLGKIKGVLRYRCQATPIQKGDSNDGSTPKQAPARENGDFSSSTLPHESPFLQTGNSSAMMVLQNGRLSPKTGDSLSPHHETAFSEKSPFPGQSGDFSSSTLQQKSPVSEQKGDSLSAHHKTASLQKSPVSEQKGDSQQETSPANRRLSSQSRPFPEQKGDFSSEQLPNVNVISNILSSLNVNVKGVIEYLRTTFDEEPKKRGFYYSLYKQYQQSDAWLAAAIETLLAYHKQKTQQPGKYFYDLCVLFHKNGIPQEVAERVQQYGHLTHEQLLVALVHPPTAPAAAATTSSRPSQSQRPKLVLHLPREKGRRGLTEQEARQVMELIRSDLRTCTVGIARYLQTDGSSALLIDNGSTKYPRQVWIYSVEECQTRLTTMKLRNDFFSRGEQP